MQNTEKSIIDLWSEVLIHSPPEIISFKVNTKKTALLILDLQDTNCNEERRPRCVTSIKVITNLLARARKKGMLIVYSLTSSATKEQIREEMKPLENEPIVKSGVDKFYKTNLETILKERNIEQVIITGTSAHGAVLNTVTGAVARGFSVIVPIDCLSSS
ncbi:MAG: cysteine hydrolase [Candidatus Thorarchaeota archaeon]